MSDKTYAQAVDEVRGSIQMQFDAIAFLLKPAFDQFMFEMQRWYADYLNTLPWYRELGARWKLRRARKWSE